MPTVEITFSPTGEVAIEAVGFKGKSCEKATAAFAKALGTTTKKTLKPEYYQRETSSLNQRT